MTDWFDRPSTASAIGTLWPTGEVELATQLRRGNYHRDTRHDPDLIPPAIAGYAITAFTRPGDLVFDPDCGAGTTLVEALHAGRNTIGLAGTRAHWQLARANVTAAKAAGAPVDGMVLVLDRRPTTLATAHLAGFTGQVDLILTTVRPAAPHPAPTDLALAIEQLRALLIGSRALLRPSGHLIITVAPHRNRTPPHALFDLPGQILTVALACGLTPRTRCLALTTASRTGHPHRTRSRPQQRARTRRGQPSNRGMPPPAHHTILIFRSGSVVKDIPARLTHSGRHHGDKPAVPRLPDAGLGNKQGAA